MRTKMYLAACYWVVSLMVLSAEPSEKSTMNFYLIFYSAALVNFAIASVIASNLFKKLKHDPSTNRN
jgi:uncharacterized membrane protein SirB2